MSEQHPLALACGSGCCLQLCAQLTPRCSETAGQARVVRPRGQQNVRPLLYLVDHVLIWVTGVLADSVC